MDAALRFLAGNARTVREVERRLDEFEYGEAEIMAVIERLEELGLVNDESYCSDFVDSRLRTKPVSRRHLKDQLTMHEADPAAIEAALSKINDDAEKANALAVAQKYARQFEGLDGDVKRQRLEKRLLSRGFDYDTARWALENLTGEEA